MSEKRIIKKYPNRRLYDTAVSRYITLHDIKQLVSECVDFQVRDAKTEEDLTNSTLLQIILEQEENHNPMFTRDMLEHFIRSYGNSMQSMMSNYLQQSMNLFMEQQANMKQSFSALFESNPLNYFNELANQNLRMWQNLQKNFLNPTAAAKSSEGEEKK